MKRIVLYILAITAVSALTFTGLVIYSSQAEEPAKTAINAPVEQIPLNADTLFNLVNAEREKAGLKPLVRDTRLDQSAQFKADDMVARNYFSHYDPTDEKTMNGVQKGYELTNHNTCENISENISQVVIGGTVDDNVSSVNGWMGSEPHRNAILDPQYDITGVAISGDKIVQHFCNLK